MRLYGKLLFSRRLMGGDGVRIEASFSEVYWLLTSKAETVTLSLLLEESNPEGSSVCLRVCISSSGKLHLQTVDVKGASEEKMVSIQLNK